MNSELDSISSELWLLPDGVEELLPPESKRTEELSRKLLDLYSRWGYELVVPPLIEYLESLLTGVGQDLDLQTFKITDQVTGRMMGIRADMTPQLARIDARNAQQGAHRVCCVGAVLRSRTSNLFPSRVPIQTGCELFGVADTAADIEAISMMLESLNTAEIEDIHLDLSHVAIYRHILSESGLSPEKTHLLLGALQRKSVPEVQAMAERIADEQIRKYVLALLTLAGNPKVIDEASVIFCQVPKVCEALTKLAKVVEVISVRYPKIKIFIDLCEMRGFNYHTGLVFAAYTPGMGQAIAQGGRYNGIGGEFGRARPATGFSADLKALLRIGKFKPTQQPKAILAPDVEDSALWQKIIELRKKGRVIRCMPGDENLDWQQQCDRQIIKDGKGEWLVVALS